MTILTKREQEVAIFISDKIDFKSKIFVRDKEKLIVLKGLLFMKL